MEVIYERCCGIDLHKNMVMACIFVKGKKEIRKYGTFTEELEELMAWIREKACEVVAMESTGVYWKPVYNLLEEAGIKAIVVNAQHIKGVPGRKTDVKDAEWIADLVRHGLVKESYIPNRAQRELREMTRYRQDLIEEKAREINRIQKVLEGANIKLASVISDVSGKTGISILKAIINGTTDTKALSQLAIGRITQKIPLLQKALKGSVGEHQRQMLKHQIRHIEFLIHEIERIDEEVQKKTEYAENEIELLDTMPGIGRRSAERIIAETGIDMNQFKSAAQFASWAGLVPECNKSAGKKKSVKIRKGNKTLKTTLVECACSAIRDKNGFFHARYKKISARRGGKRALIAIAHSMLLSIYAMLRDKQAYRDLGSNYFYEIDKDKIMTKNIKSLQKLGYSVTLNLSA